MRQLVQEGLARHEVHRGTFVREITPADFVDLYRAREAVETAAVDLILEAPTSDLTRVHAALAAMAVAAETGQPWQEIADIDMSLHEAIIDASESPRLVRMYATLAAESRMAVPHAGGGVSRGGRP
jgi:DNA-binding GntR family transcriptional regulator